MEEHFFFYKLKMIRKGVKPPIWRRAYVPAYVTFSQMALVLMELLEIPVNPSIEFEFEFYHRKDRIIERGAVMKPSYEYDYFSASETFVDQRFREESWFTFRVLDSSLHIPEYRIEFELGAELDIKDEDGDEDGAKGLTFPLISEQKSSKIDEYWSSPNKINDRMKENYQLSFGEPSQDSLQVLAERIEQGKTGIIVGTKRKDQEVQLKGSIKSTIQGLSALLAQVQSSSLATSLFPSQAGADVDAGVDAYVNADTRASAVETSQGQAQSQGRAQSQLQAPGQPQPQATPPLQHKPPYLENVLKTIYTTAELLELAKYYDIPVTASGKQKAKAVYEITRYLLSAQNMRRILLQVNDADLQLFDAMMEKGRFFPNDKESLLDDDLFELCYVVEFKNGSMEVPEDVKIIYSTLKKTGYLEYHKKAFWILKCMKAFAVHYVYAPAKILYRLYRTNKEMNDSFQDFCKFLDELPPQESLCKVHENYVVARALPSINIGKQIEKMTSGMEYYILSQEEIEIFSDWEYPITNKSYQDLAKYLEQQGADSESCRDICAKACFAFGAGQMEIDKFLDYIVKQGFMPAKQKDKEKLVQILIRVFENTRSFMFRGRTPLEREDFITPKPFVFDQSPATNSKISNSSKSHGSAVPLTSSASAAPPASLASSGTSGSPYAINFPRFDGPFSAGTTTDAEIKDSAQTAKESAKPDKKVYPNDPCPCGSGLKYKKCCGRK